ncbi:MAG: hypothetical protein RL701_406 [Pseudomonadota bacterium]
MNVSLRLILVLAVTSMASTSLVGCTTGCPKGTVQIDDECQRFALAGDGSIITGGQTGSLDSGVTKADAETETESGGGGHDAGSARDSGIDAGKPVAGRGGAGEDAGLGPVVPTNGGAGSVAPPDPKPEAGRGGGGAGKAGAAGEPPPPPAAGSGGKPVQPTGAGAGGQAAPIVVPTAWFCTDGDSDDSCICVDSQGGPAVNSCTPKASATCCYLVRLANLGGVVSCVCATPPSPTCDELVANPTARKMTLCPPPAGN